MEADDDTILDQTSRFRSYTENLKQELKDLISLRKRTSSKEDEDYKKLYSSVMYHLTSLRSNHRTLYIVKPSNLMNLTNLLNFYEFYRKSIEIA